MHFCTCNANDLQKFAEKIKNPNMYDLVWDFLDFHFRKLDTVAIIQPSVNPSKSLIFRKEFYKFLNSKFKKSIIRIGLKLSEIKSAESLKSLREIAKGYIIYLRKPKSVIEVFSIMDSLKIHWDFETRFFVICEAECKRKHLFLDTSSQGPFSILNVLPMIIVVDVNDEIVCEVCTSSNKTLEISLKVLFDQIIYKNILHLLLLSLLIISSIFEIVLSFYYLSNT